MVFFDQKNKKKRHKMTSPFSLSFIKKEEKTIKNKEKTHF